MLIHCQITPSGTVELASDGRLSFAWFEAWPQVHPHCPASRYDPRNDGKLDLELATFRIPEGLLEPSVWLQDRMMTSL
jgi:hypothetical protein